MQEKVIAIIVSFNRLEKLKQTLEVTLAQAFYAVVVVDNASTDGTQAYLKTQTDKRLVVLENTHNTGGAGGFYQAMQYAHTHYDADWLLLFDDDARPHPDLLERFAELKKDKCDALASAVFFPDGAICEMNRASWNPFWHRDRFWATLKNTFKGAEDARAGFHLADNAYQEESLVAVDASSFVGLFVRQKVARNLPLPEAKLFIYGDDLLYTLRLTKAGYRLFFAPSLRFVHDCATYSKTQLYKPLWKAYFAYRNGLYIYRMAAGGWFYLVVLLRLLQWGAKGRHYRDKKAYFRVLKMAFKDGLKGDFSRDVQSIISQYQQD